MDSSDTTLLMPDANTSTDNLTFVDPSPVARRRLADKRLSIKDISGQLNFSGEFYFSHFFRHHSGMTPTDFRQHLKG